MPCIDAVCATSLHSASLLSPCSNSSQRFSGDFTERATPVPIPNTAVKPLRADDTAWATAWESRTSPDPFLGKRPPIRRAFSFAARFETKDVDANDEETVFDRASSFVILRAAFGISARFLRWLTASSIGERHRAERLASVAPRGSGRPSEVGSEVERSGRHGGPGDASGRVLSAPPHAGISTGGSR